MSQENVEMAGRVLDAPFPSPQNVATPGTPLTVPWKDA
jgi:hypothetical protein